MFTSSPPRNRAHPQSSQRMESKLARQRSGLQQPRTQACPMDHPKSLCAQWARNIPPSSHKSKSDIVAVTVGTRRCSVPSPVVTEVQGDARCPAQWEQAERGLLFGGRCWHLLPVPAPFQPTHQRPRGALAAHCKTPQALGHIFLQLRPANPAPAPSGRSCKDVSLPAPPMFPDKQCLDSQPSMRAEGCLNRTCFTN